MAGGDPLFRFQRSGPIRGAHFPSKKVPLMSKTSLKNAVSPIDAPDFGSPGLRARKGAGLVEEAGPDGVLVTHVRLAADPLDRYLARGELVGRQALAATRLRDLWHYCHFEAGLTMRWGERVSGSRAPDSEKMTETVAAARQRFAKALRAAGVRLSSVLSRVVCEGVSARDWAIETGRHPSSGIEMLRLALDLVADHWGFLENENKT